MIRLLRPALVMAIVAVAGCSDLGTPLEPKPQSHLSATALDFGTVAVSQSTTRSITISNVGTGKLTGNAAAPCAGYSLQSGAGSFALASGELRTIVVKFAPGAIGSFPCALDLGPNVPAVAISGAGALQNPGARCIVLQDSIAFGGIRSGEVANAQFEVINAGTAPLLINIVSSSVDYEVVLGGGPGQIPAGSSINVIVSFHPTTGGRSSSVIALGPECPDIGVSGIGITVSFASDIQPIFVNHCRTCHEFAFPEYYDTYYYLVPYGRVTPFDLDQSRLYQKITGNPAYGNPMPFGGPPLPADEIDMIRRWILEGATKN